MPTIQAHLEGADHGAKTGFGGQCGRESRDVRASNLMTIFKRSLNRVVVGVEDDVLVQKRFDQAIESDGREGRVLGCERVCGCESRWR